MNKILLISLLMVGCRPTNRDDSVKHHTVYSGQTYATGVTEVEIDGCHYFMTSQAQGGVVLTHKGNCPNHKDK